MFVLIHHCQSKLKSPNNKTREMCFTVQCKYIIYISIWDIKLPLSYESDCFIKSEGEMSIMI